ncbi:MAG: response regulator transcription factor [Chthoniobacterales bacterium]
MQPQYPETLISQNEQSSESGRSTLDAARDKELRTVCLVDDDPSVLKATGRLLSSAGWEVEGFSDPTAFLDYAGEAKPHVVVVDIRMPIMDGFEVQKRLRTISPNTKVVILTSADDPAVRARVMDAGACGFLLKPVRDHELFAGIDAALSLTDR